MAIAGVSTRPLAIFHPAPGVQVPNHDAGRYASKMPASHIGKNRLPT